MRTVAISLGLLLMVVLGARTEGAVFSNPASIAFSQVTPNGIPGPASPYPSSISVSGLSGNISKLTVRIVNLNHDRPDDIELLLVGPTGAKYVLMADVGGTTTPAVNFTITFDDAAVNFMPDSGPLATGTNKPTCVDFQNTINVDFPAPAPAGPYNTAAPRGAATLGSVFNGTNPNGTWSLYAVDDVANAVAANSIAGGWSLDISAGNVEPSITTVTSSLNPSFTSAPDNSVTLTATVRRTNNTAVTTGTVVFKEGATVLQGATGLNASGQASFTTSFVTEGTHVITAEYSGAGSINGSLGSFSQIVARHTVVNGSTFCNPGTITLPASGSPGTGSVYPSQIFVSGLTGSITRLSVTLSNITHPRPDDLQVLLVGPTGAQLVLMAQAGGTASGVANVTVTLADDAGATLADAGPLASGSYRPTSYNSSPVLFPAPAPAGPYNQPAPTGGASLGAAFRGTAPGGAWSLYVIDDVPTAGQGASIGGWCLNVVTTNEMPSKTLLTSASNPSLVGQTNVFTATVINATNNNVITAGTVSFKEGSTVLAFGVPLNLSGKAFLTNATLSEGVHIITAEYSGIVDIYSSSSATITQIVDRPAVVSGTSFCNPGPIVIPATGSPATASVYPSRITVANFAPSFQKLSVTVSNLSHPRPDDLRVLLVSPAGVGFVLMADAGGTTTAAVNVTLTFDDGGALIPSAGPISSGLVKPSDYNPGPITFPAPAPAGPHHYGASFGTATLASAFNSTNPNGTWSLYVIDDVPTAGQNATIANGWCLNLVSPPAIVRLRANPQTAASIRTNGFRFLLTGESNRLYATEFSSNLTTWVPILTNQYLGTELEIIDIRATNAPRRFYRARGIP